MSIRGFSGPARAALRCLATGKRRHSTRLRHRCRHAGGEGDVRCVGRPKCATARVERRPGRTCHTGRNYPRGKGRDRSASPRRSPKALGQDITTWSLQSSSAGHQWAGTGVALDRPVSHRHPRLSLAPAFAATSRFQNSLACRLGLNHKPLRARGAAPGRRRVELGVAKSRILPLPKLTRAANPSEGGHYPASPRNAQWSNGKRHRSFQADKSPLPSN